MQAHVCRPGATFRRHVAVRCSAEETAKQRYARAAKKYHPGPLNVGARGLQIDMYMRPNLNQDVDTFDVKQLMSAYTTSAAQNPQLYTMKLTADLKKLHVEERFDDWHEII